MARDSRNSSPITIFDLILVVLLPIVLGFFAYLSLTTAIAANDQSQIANQIALLSLCLDLNETSSSCRLLLSSTDQILTKIFDESFEVAGDSLSIAASGAGSERMFPILIALLVVLVLLFLVVIGDDFLKIRRVTRQETEAPAGYQGVQVHQQQQPHQLQQQQ